MGTVRARWLTTCASMVLLLLSGAAIADFPEVGSNDFRISFMGPPSDPDYDAYSPAIALNDTAGEFFVVWHGDANLTVQEVYGRRIDAATGALLGADSVTLATGVDLYAEPDVAYNGDDGEYLVVFEEDVSGDIAIRGVFVNAATGTVTIGPFIVASVGSSGVGLYSALQPSVVYNPVAGEYLVVFAGDLDPTYYLPDIFCTRVWRVGGDVHLVGPSQISDLGPVTPTAGYESSAPDVACDANGRYLVVWRGADVGPYDYDVYGQRLDAAAAAIGTDDFQISQMGVSSTYTVGNPTVAYNALEDEYLVAFGGTKEGVYGGSEIYVQRLTAEGVEVGTDDLRISDMGAAGSYSYRAYNAVVAWNAAANEYLVTWESDDDESGVVNDEYEIFGQLLGGDTGTEIGPDDMRLSDMGADGNADFDAHRPAVAANPANHEYLTVWDGDTFEAFVLTDDEYEIFGQRVEAVTIFVDGFESGGMTRWSASAP